MIDAGVGEQITRQRDLRLSGAPFLRPVRAPRSLSSLTESWFIVRSRPACEGKSKTWLERDACIVYLPMLLLQVGSRDSRGRVVVRERQVPLIPNYLFARVTTKGGYRVDPVALRYLPGVLDLVRTGDGRCARVANDVVEALRDQEHNGAIPAPVVPPFRKGEQVEMRGYENWSLRFLRMTGSDRAAILLSIFNTSKELVVDVKLLERRL